MKFKGTNDAAIATDNPGGDRARDNGCRCNSFDNCHGYGCYGEFWIEPTCPLHGAIEEIGEVEGG